MPIFSRAAKALLNKVIPARVRRPSANDNSELKLIFTHQQAQEYATIQLEGQYLLAAHLVNSKLAPHKETIDVLVDFGCGAGKSTRAIAPSARSKGRVIGVDISDEILEQARLLTQPVEPATNTKFEYRQINTVHGRETIPLSDGTADAVSTTIVLQELQSEEQLTNALAEMGRIAKSGARFAAACVSDLITCEDFTTFTYAPFPDNAERTDNIRKCSSTVSRIVWENDRHWSKDILIRGLRDAGWSNIVAEYPLAPKELRPFPKRPEVDWKDERRVAALLLITAIKL